MKKIKLICTLSAFIFPMLLLSGCQNIAHLPEKKQEPVLLSSEEITQKLIEQDSHHQKLRNDVWTFMRNERTIAIPDNERIAEIRKYYLSQPKGIYNLALRSEPYIYWIMDALVQRDMPIELAFLPMLESAFNPQAKSSAKAAGLWQMIPSTAKAYGLKKNQSVDDRYDILQSTSAALDMLQYLNKRFNGDWLLTLAAYNSGEGRISRAIRWNQSIGLPTNYWALNLPQETMNYVPKLLALADIFTHSNKYNIPLPPLNHDNSLGLVDVGQQIKLDKIAEILDLPKQDIIMYNAGYLKKKTNNDAQHLIVLPKTYISDFIDKLKKENYTTVQKIKYQPKLQLPHDIDTSLTNKRYAQITNKELKYYVNKHRDHSRLKYKVKSGDSLYNIARKYDTHVKELARVNKITNIAMIKPGQTILIPVKNGSNLVGN